MAFHNFNPGLLLGASLIVKWMNLSTYCLGIHNCDQSLYASCSYNYCQRCCLYLLSHGLSVSTCTVTGIVRSDSRFLYIVCTCLLISKCILCVCMTMPSSILALMISVCSTHNVVFSVED